MSAPDLPTLEVIAKSRKEEGSKKSILLSNDETLWLIAAVRERDELKAEVWRLEAGLERLSVATSQLLSGGTFEIGEEVNATPEEATDGS